MTHNYANFPPCVKKHISAAVKDENSWSEERITISSYVDDNLVTLNEKEFGDFIKSRVLNTFGSLLDDDIEEMTEIVNINYNVIKIPNDNPNARVKNYYLLNENGQEPVEINLAFYDCDECLID